MATRCPVPSLLLIAILTWVGLIPAWAQPPEDPAATAPAEPVRMAPQPEDSAVAAILEGRPTTPAELTRAGKILADLRRPDLARQMFQKVLAARLDETQLADLETRYGSAMFTEIASRDELAPEGRQLARLVLDAAGRAVRDEARLAGLVKQLSDPSADVRLQAITGLLEAQDAAIGPLVDVLADPARASEHDEVRSTLMRFGVDAKRAMTAVLENSDPGLKTQAIQVLGQLGDPQLVTYLLSPYAAGRSDPQVRTAAEQALTQLVGSLPSRKLAADMLFEKAKWHFERLQPLREDADGRVELWTWDESRERPVKGSHPAEDAQLLIAARFAREAHSIDPENVELLMLHLATMVEQASYEQGLGQPLEIADGTPAGTLARFDVGVVEELLQYGMDSGHIPVATVAARILGMRGTADELLYRGPRPGALARAAQHVDRRLRFAAVGAIFALKPDRPFAGSSSVPAAVGYFISSTGTPRALIASYSTEEAQRIGGYVGAMGYEVETAIRGGEVIALAAASPDYHFILVDAGLQQPTVDFMLQQLRHDNRTALLPVGILARDGYLDRARKVARGDPLVEAFPRPHTQEAVLWQVERIPGLADRDMVSQAERSQQALGAMEWMVEWTAREHTSPFDFTQIEPAVLDARYVPGLAPLAMQVLGRLDTPTSRQAMVEVAANATQAAEVRALAIDWLGDRGTAESQQRLADLMAEADQQPRIRQAAWMALKRSTEVDGFRSPFPSQPEGIAACGQLGTHTSQKMLVDLASRRTAAIANRQAAVEAFWQSIRAYGLLLSNAEVLLQYDRYNASETLDRATQKVLASILDCIEAAPPGAPAAVGAGGE